MTDKLSFFGVGEEELATESGLHTVCNKGRRGAAELASTLAMMAEEVELALRHADKGHPMLASLDTRFRARMVASHLKHAAELMQLSAVSFARTWHSFRRHYIAELNTQAKARKPRQTFRFDQSGR